MPDNELQKLSPAYRLPASDLDFILSDSMQGVRFLLEFAKADERWRAWGVRTTIVVLGSARIRQANGPLAARRGRPAWRAGTTSRGASAALHPSAAAPSRRSATSATTSLRPAAVPASWRRPTAAHPRWARLRSDSISNCRASRSQILIRHPN